MDDQDPNEGNADLKIEIRDLATRVRQVDNEIIEQRRWAQVLQRIENEKNKGEWHCEFSSSPISYSEDAIIYLRFGGFPFGYRVTYLSSNPCKWIISWHPNKVWTTHPPEVTEVDRAQLLETWQPYFRRDFRKCDRHCMRGAFGHLSNEPLVRRDRMCEHEYDLFIEAHTVFGTLDEWCREEDYQETYFAQIWVAIFFCVFPPCFFWFFHYGFFQTWPWMALPMNIALAVIVSLGMLGVGIYWAGRSAQLLKEHERSAKALTDRMEHDRTRALQVFFTRDDLTDNSV